jgi:GMP synthase (glutamine-hydrolysing)
MKILVIIKTGSTFPVLREQFGDFEDWIARECSDGLAIKTVNAEAGEVLPDLGGVSGIAVTGSPAMVTDKTQWMQTLSTWLVQAVQASVPTLGICFGHQLLAQALGGRVDYHPQGREIGTVTVNLTDAGQQDPLLGTLPAVFSAHVTHAQSVIRLPAEAIHLAGNGFEPHHAFRVGDCAWGVQFHPEFSAAIMRGYITVQAEALQTAGRDVGTLQASVIESVANGLLRAFSQIVQHHR